MAYQDRLAFLPKPVEGLQRKAPSGDYSFLSGLSTGGGGNPATSGNPWWMDTLNALGSMSHILTDQTARWTDGSFKFQEDVLPAMQMGGLVSEWAKNVGRGQLDAWRDGSLSIRDIPVFGGMAEVGDTEGFSQTLGNLGAKGRWKTWGGVAGDILFDPTTYLTFGAGSVGKIGAQAGLEAASEAAIRFGAKAGKDVDSTLQNIYQGMLQKTGSEQAAERALTVAQRNVEAAQKSARFRGQNAVLNFDVPFTNTAIPIGEKGARNPFRITEDVIGQPEMVKADDMLRTIGFGDKTAQGRLLQNIYGIGDVTQLNRQQFKHLQENFDKLEGLRGRQVANDGNAKAILDEITQSWKEVGKRDVLDLSDFTFENITKMLDPRSVARIENYLRALGVGGDLSKLTSTEVGKLVNDVNQNVSRGLETFGGALGKMAGGIKGKTAANIAEQFDIAGDAARTAEARIVEEPILKESADFTPKDVSPEAFYKDMDVAGRFDEFVQDAGGKSAMRRGFEKTRVGKSFNTRPNYAAGAIRDTEQAMFGGRRVADMTLNAIENTLKGMTAAERVKIVDVVEGTKRADTPEMQAAADEIKKVLQDVKDKEIQAGVLQNVRRGYFPHTLSDKANLEKLQELAKNDPELDKLIGKSQSSQFSKERKTFQTMAQVDTYLAKLEEKIQKATGAELDELMEKRDMVAGMFERDPVAALRKRLSKSVQVTAMKKLYTQFEKDGLIYKPDNISPRATGADFEKIDGKVAGRLGLESGSYVHKDILEGLQRVNDIFTDSNAQKLLDTVDLVAGAWKTLVTTARPSHHLTNLIGNVANNSMAGVSVRAYPKAAGVLRRLANGTATKADRELVAEALEKGVLSHGETAEYAKSAVEALRLPMEGVPIAGKWITLMRKFGDNVDNFSRLAHYIDRKKAYGSVDKAAESVRTYLFNYREVTTTDRIMRIGFPFWNWTRRNVPLQLHKLFQTPRFASTYMRVQQTLQDEAEAQGKEIPSYMDDKGLAIGDKMYNPNLPLSDLSQLSNPLKMGVGMLTPFVKVPMEVASNTSTLTERPIDWQRFNGDGWDEKRWMEYGLQQLGMIGKTINLANPTTDDNFGEKLLQLLIGKPATIEGGN